MPKVRKTNWTETPDPTDYEAAADYLSLLLPTRTAQLAVVRWRNGPMESRRARDLPRASGLADLLPENPSVARKLKDLKRVSGSHRFYAFEATSMTARCSPSRTATTASASSYLLDEGTDIPCRPAEAELPRPDETLAAAVSARPEHSH